MKTNGKPPIAAVPTGHGVQFDQQQPDAGPPKAPGLDLLDGAQAFGLWLLLERPPKNAERSKGGIFLPDAVRERPTWIVRSKGEKVTIPVEVGDHVAFDGSRVMVDEEGGTAWAFAMEGQIFGKLDPAKLTNRIITTKAAI